MNEQPGTGASQSTVLSVRDLEVSFDTDEGLLRAVSGVTFEVPRGKIVALVGESGCGKSVTSYSILRLIQNPGRIAGGSITLHAQKGESLDVTGLRETDDALYDLRGNRVSMIFQEPMTALSPVHTIGNQLREVLQLHREISRADADARIVEMLGRVGIPAPERRLTQYPFELSGGMRQRVVIAMAMLGEPELLIADEPTTALDVTIQAQVLQLMNSLQREEGNSVLLITHDLAVVAQVADYVAVMYMGRIVERGPTREIMKHPRHPYTIALLQSLPGLHLQHAKLPSIKGSVPSLTELPQGCAFHPRCEFARAGRCDVNPPPPMAEIDGEHGAACLLLDEVKAGKRDARAEVEAAPASSPEKTKDLVPLLEVRNLCKFFPVVSQGLRRRVIGHVRATNDVSFDLHPNETLGLVGESGCGKTTTARCILRAIEPTRGRVIFRGGEKACDLAALSHRELKAMRPHMQMIFQDPFSSLNPRMTVGEIVSEPLAIHDLARGSERADRVDEMLRKVGLNPEHKMRYPHAFSGGQRQRIGIARALIMRPKFIVADEAVSALDVSVQAQVINLLDELKRELNLSMIFVAHDLSVVRHICDRVAVMYAGRIVELASTEELFDAPKHPYTKALLSAVPHPDPDVRMNLDLKGEVADAANLPAGCSFHPRCGVCEDRCRSERPELEKSNGGRKVACHLVK